MKNSGNAIPCKYDFSLLVAQKICWNRNRFHYIRLTESNTKWIFHNFCVDTDTAVHNLSFPQKYRPGMLVLVKEAFITSITDKARNSNWENCSDKWLRKFAQGSISIAWEQPPWRWNYLSSNFHNHLSEQFSPLLFLALSVTKNVCFTRIAYQACIFCGKWQIMHWNFSIPRAMSYSVNSQATVLPSKLTETY